MIYFFLFRAMPLPIQRIPRINPAIGIPVVCIGMVPAWMLVVVAALTVLVVGVMVLVVVAAFISRDPMLLISPGLYPSTVTVGIMLYVPALCMLRLSHRYGSTPAATSPTVQVSVLVVGS